VRGQGKKFGTLQFDDKEKNMHPDRRSNEIL